MWLAKTFQTLDNSVRREVNDFDRLISGGRSKKPVTRFIYGKVIELAANADQCNRVLEHHANGCLSVSEQCWEVKEYDQT